MSRHGYIDDDTHDPGHAMWRGRVASAIRGKRGQSLLKELAAAMDAMPDKALVSRQLQTADGDCCAIGCITRTKGIDLTEYADSDESDLEELNESIAERLNVATCLVQEIEYENDEGSWDAETPQQRWIRMRRWVARHIKEAATSPTKERQ